ncbi:MAG TPA: CAP domain-containing protein [Gaiellaceae bacterium]|nr:CAP domain-containing protein [Gaiellaceae bacterium]
MRRRFGVVLAILAATAAAWAIVSPAGATPKSAAGAQRIASMRPLDQGVLANVNAVRVANGLRPLISSSGLAAAAHQHSVQMAVDGYFAHNSADGGSFDQRIARFYPLAGRSYWSVGENLLWSSPDVDASAALQMWMHSPEHRANLLSPRWRQIGISAVHATTAAGPFGGHPVTIITADFGVRR